MTNDLARAVNDAWDVRESLGPASHGDPRDAVEAALAGLDEGTLRLARARWTATNETSAPRWC